MAQMLANIAVAMLGGDLRELELAKTMVSLGVDLRLVGFPPDPALQGAKYYQDPLLAVRNAQFILCPMSNTDMHGYIINRLDDGDPIYLPAVMTCLPPKTVIFIGVAKPIIRDIAEHQNLMLIETAEIDEIAILNSIPTAEGAIQLAMTELPITIHESNCLVVGFGRCGKTLARLLHGLGAYVTVVARQRADLARAREMGLQTATLEELPNFLNPDIIFNSVPALVITEEYLRKLANKPLIIDLAAAPGGVDFATAEELGIKAILALSLPGKVAPVTAGKILSTCIPRLLQDILGGEADGT